MVWPQDQPADFTLRSDMTYLINAGTPTGPNPVRFIGTTQILEQ